MQPAVHGRIFLFHFWSRGSIDYICTGLKFLGSNFRFHGFYGGPSAVEELDILKSYSTADVSGLKSGSTTDVAGSCSSAAKGLIEINGPPKGLIS